MKTEKQIRHEELIKLLNKFPQYQDGNGNGIINEFKESKSSKDFPSLEVADINRAVVCFTDFLNIIAGSMGGYDFYKLMQAYMLDKGKRDAMNKIIG